MEPLHYSLMLHFNHLKMAACCASRVRTPASSLLVATQRRHTPYMVACQSRDCILMKVAYDWCCTQLQPPHRSTESQLSRFSPWALISTFASSYGYTGALQTWNFWQAKQCWCTAVITAVELGILNIWAGICATRTARTVMTLQPLGSSLSGRDLEQTRIASTAAAKCTLLVPCGVGHCTIQPSLKEYSTTLRTLTRRYTRPNPV